ncbi:hypothetical protein N0V93_004195 [Gnomoniopsis smithogilvyi]|uniref:Uncharacterized protein n=1 Tax=Gnomoniopsis smithogilvyi TaxID=1191159 RepID=A0A9W8YUB7_9PEZI|nr:hypothetical protein N0V93_004195 [Gnomoniopsis smithogilvyi]
MRFNIILAALVAVVAAAPTPDPQQGGVSTTCSPDGAKAGSVICNNPAYTGRKLQLNNQAFNLGGCAASRQANALCEARDN